MLGVLGTEAVQQYPHPVRSAVIVGVACQQKIGCLGQKHPTFPKAKAMQQVQAIEKNSVLVCLAITIPILENHNRIRRLLPRQRMGPCGRIANPQTAA